jgi:hypothetical protein
MKGLQRRHLRPVPDFDGVAPLPLYAHKTSCARCKKVNKNLIWAVPAGIVVVGGLGIALGYMMGKKTAPRPQTVHAVG